MKRNGNREPWFTVHLSHIKEGDVVELVSIEGEPNRSAEYPPIIYVNRGVTTDNYNYKASLSCYDYVR